MSIDIRVVEDPLAECAAAVAAALPKGPVVLTGGSTNKAYSSLASGDWAGTRIWFTDERCVPVEDERSNYGGFRDAVGAGAVESAHVYRIPAEDGPEPGAVEYERMLLEHGIRETGFELFVIGLGPDGHICSMFPGQDSLTEDTRLAVGVPVAGLDPKVPRVTLTYPAITLARNVIVMAAGSGKADALSACFAEDASASREWPGSLLSEYAQTITVLTDEDGAARL